MKLQKNEICNTGMDSGRPSSLRLGFLET